MRITIVGLVLPCIFSYSQVQNISFTRKPFAQGVWHEAKIRSIFNHLSEISKIDFVIDPGVSGEITLSVKNKTWKEVCDIICRMKQLIAVPEENYIYVMTEKEFFKQQQNKEIGMRNLADVRSLEREIIKLSNTSASEMQTPIKDLLSKRGKITVVNHNNSIIIYDTKENIYQIKRMIAKLDVEVDQISISCKIIEVGTGLANDIGIQWNLFNDRLQHLPTNPSGQGIIPMVLQKATYGIMSPQKFNFTMEYLFSESKSNIVAQPQITTIDNKQAKIFMGSQVPVTYLDKAGNTLVKMIDAGTELLVTPHVTGEGRIMMDLKPTKKSYTLTDKGVPIISEQSAQTNVVVNDGETVVIAGLTADSKRETEGGIPILKDIPLIGYLFKKSSRSKDRKDLIIFVTPHIIRRNISEVSTTSKPENIDVDTLSMPLE